MSNNPSSAVLASARALLDHYAFKKPEDIKLELIAKEQFGAKVKVDTLEGAEAQLVRRGKSALITLSDRVKDIAARRFSLAHELGHLALCHHTRSAAILACNPQRRRRTGPEGDASAWGSEILMPTSLVAPMCQVTKADLDAPQQIARDFTVSILAASIRFVELTNLRCAAVFSVRGKVVWCATSAGWGKQNEIVKSMRLRPGSVAHEYTVRGEIDERMQRVPANAWFDIEGDVELFEHAVCAPLYGSVLSMLWAPEEIASLVLRP